jgi:hypothetical protein
MAQPAASSPGKRQPGLFRIAEFYMAIQAILLDLYIFATLHKLTFVHTLPASIDSSIRTPSTRESG